MKLDRACLAGFMAGAPVSSAWAGWYGPMAEDLLYRVGPSFPELLGRTYLVAGAAAVFLLLMLAALWGWGRGVRAAAVLAILAITLTGGVSALADEAPPPLLPAVLEAEPEQEFGLSFAEDKRREAMRAAALAYGSQAGLARRTWEIRRLIEKEAGRLDRIFRFRALTVRRHGFVVVPPVVGETRRAFKLARDGRKAASAARVVRIVEGGRLASAPPHWRDFLIRSWPSVEKPISVLFPRDEAEEAVWSGWVAEGWAAGFALADEVYETDLDRLTATFEGLARWGAMHEARMVGAPEVQVSRAGVAGDGQTMRVKETLVRMGEPAVLNMRPREWRLVLRGLDEGSGMESGE